ncbi:XisI protein [Leptolyngbya cf. ectocarpi LEGE 11479]|uniref:XisI protein n=1 Tax=Leptolyngbya cf. ectocarpi LEGE 11479 TaxID=1828722 RepID=A0A929F7B2_LEPEC|nr:XisI protein [Leptolyngbya ectocarpi]MBE9068136.1 XisI protein [Leptolyngbya cf. ectocarpi LEGE 11479]
MDRLTDYRQLVRDLIMDHTKVPYKHGDIRFETVFDSESDRYLLIILGRENKRYEHGCLLHVDIIDGKIWIQRDGTEEGIATQLVEAGVPKDQIVLGFKSPERRKDTEFAVA